MKNNLIKMLTDMEKYPGIIKDLLQRKFYFNNLKLRKDVKKSG